MVTAATRRPGLSGSPPVSSGDGICLGDAGLDGVLHHRVVRGDHAQAAGVDGRVVVAELDELLARGLQQVAAGAGVDLLRHLLHRRGEHERVGLGLA